MNIFDKNVFEKVENIRIKAEHDIETLSNIPVRLCIVVDSYEVEGDTLSQAMNIIAKSIGNRYSDYFNKSNKREIVELRHIATYLLINFFQNVTITVLSNKMGKHHTTIIHSRKVAQDRISAKDEIFMKKYNKARKELSKFMGDLEAPTFD